MGNSRSSGCLSGKEEHRAKQRFKQATGKGRPYLTRENFNKLLGHSSYAEGLFTYVDTDGDGTVSFKEIREEIKAFRSMNTPDARLRVLYNYYDSNHDGIISRSEVADAMRVACGKEISKIQLEQLVNSTMETFDLDKDGFLNFDEFCDLMHNAGLELTL